MKVEMDLERYDNLMDIKRKYKEIIDNEGRIIFIRGERVTVLNETEALKKVMDLNEKLDARLTEVLDKSKELSTSFYAIQREACDARALVHALEKEIEKSWIHKLFGRFYK